MQQRSSIAVLVISSALAACGEETKPAPKADKPAATAKQDATAKAAPTPAPAKPWSSVDAKGFDWAPHMGAIHFDTDWKAAMARAKSEKKPLMILFTEKKSADAVKMGSGALKDPRVVEASNAFVVALVDAEADASFADRYAVREVPSIVYADEKGDAAGSTFGQSAADEVLRDIKGALDTLKEDAEEKGK